MPWNSRSTATDSDKNVDTSEGLCANNQMSKLRYWISPYEWFNFYNPLLFSLHPTSLSKWKSQLIILTCRAVIQRSPSGCLQVAQQMPLGDFPCLGCQHITPGSPSGVPWEHGGSPFGRLWLFFPPITPQIPTGRRAEAGRQPGDVPQDAGR